MKIMKTTTGDYCLLLRVANSSSNSQPFSVCGADVRPDGSGSIGIAVEWAGSKNFRQPLTRKIKDWGAYKKVFDSTYKKSNSNEYTFYS